MFGFSLKAQTGKDSTLNREMTLEREYNPTIRDASRLNFLPEVKEPVANKSVVTFSSFAIPFNVQPSIVTLPPSKLFSDLASSYKKGYLVVGVGPFLNAEIDLGYRFLDTEKDRLGIYVSNRYASGKIKYVQDDQKQKMKVNDTWAGINYEHDFSNFMLYTGLKYTFSGFNYYGYSIPTVYSYPGADKSIDQNNNLIDFNIGVNSQNHGLFNYLVDLDYSHFNQKYATYKGIKGPKENRAKFSWDLNVNLSGESKAGLGGAMKVFSYDTTEPVTSSSVPYFQDYNGLTDFSLRPYYEIEGDVWKVHLGLQYYFSSHLDPKSGFAPDIAAEYQPVDNTVIYLLATGGLNDNAFSQIFYENRYISPQYRIKDSATPLDATLGVRYSFINSFWLDIFTGYRYTKQEHFYMQESPLYLTGSDYTRIADNLSAPDYLDAKVFKIGGNLKYKYTNTFEAELKLCYYNWSVSTDEEGRSNLHAWNKPDITIDVNAGYKFEIPLRLDLAYHSEMGRKANVFDQSSYQVFDMKNINELNFSATYSLSDALSFYAKLNNLLCQTYDLWYGYPAQNVNIIAGVSFKF